jgi:putative peptidoglycan lipid II flippase
VIAFREKFREGLAVLLTFLLPAAGAYLFLGEPLIELLLQRGSFTAQDTQDTARMLAGFSLGLPFFAVFLYCVRAFHARRNTRTPFWMNLFENTLNVVLVLPFIALFDEPGLSLAYSVAYLVAAVVAVVILNRHVRHTITLRGLTIFIRGFVVAALVVAVSAAVAWWLRNGTDAGAILEILVTLGVAVPVFGVSTWVLRPHGFEDAIDTFARGLRRRTGTARR